MKRSPAALLGLCLVAACGGSPAPQPAQPTAPAKPVAAPEGPADVSAVPDPKTLLVFGRVNAPSKVVGVVGGWVGMPLPAADAIGEILAGEQIGDALDLDRPVDVAVASDPRGKSPKPVWAMSAAVKSPAEAKSILAQQFQLTPAGNGVMRLEEKGRPKGGDEEDDAPERSCALYPAFGAASMRLVCGSAPAATEALGPWLARSAPRRSHAADVHIEAKLDPLRPIITQGRTLLPAMATNMLGMRRADNAAVADLVNAAIGDGIDFALDLERLDVDMSVTEPAATATVTVRFQDTTALVTRLATSHPERADAPPAAFWHVPADADAAMFHRGLDEKDLEHPRDLVLKVVSAALEKEKVPDADRKALGDAISHYVALFSAPGVYAKGLDWPAVQKTVASSRAADAKTKPDARRAAIEQLAGWSLYEIDEPIAKVGPIAKEFAMVVSRPGIQKALKDMNKEAPNAPAPTLKVTPASAKAGQLPKDTIHMELTVVHALEAAPPAPAAAAAATGKGGKKDDKGDKKTAAAAPAPAAKLDKPEKMHVFVVPDAGHTWIAMGIDEALTANHARAALASSSDATLSKRDGLDDLKNAKVTAGGFIDVRGVLGGMPLAFVIEKPTDVRDPFKNLAAAPSQGATPIVFSTLAQAPSGGSKAGSVVATAKVPRAAIVDIVTVAMRH